MLVLIETGTDTGSVGLGDPELLAPLRECRGRDFERGRADAVASGALWVAQTGADGAYLVHLYVDEQVPSHLAPHLTEPVVVERFRIESGRLMVAGEEFFAGASSLDEHPHMGREVLVEPGEYRLTAFRGDVSDDVLEARFASRATEQERRAWRFGNDLTAVSVLATLAALVVGLAIFSWAVSQWLALLPLAGATALWLARSQYCRGDRYRSAEKLFRAVERELPSFAVVLEKRPSAPTSG